MCMCCGGGGWIGTRKTLSHLAKSLKPHPKCTISKMFVIIIMIYCLLSCFVGYQELAFAYVNYTYTIQYIYINDVYINMLVYLYI